MKGESERRGSGRKDGGGKGTQLEFEVDFERGEMAERHLLG